MTNLSSKNLERLLAKATPGPWEAEEGIYPEHITDSSGSRVLWNNSEKLFWSNEDEDVHLAALAPQLAQEVIRLREALIAWANDETQAHNALMKRTQEAGDVGTITTHKTICNRIIEILGEHNE